MKSYRLTPTAIERVLAGGRLLQCEDFEQHYAIEQEGEGEVIALVDEAQRFVAKALIGRQHKGLAWIFTLVKYDPWSADFVEETLQESLHQRGSYFQDEQTTAFRLFNGEGDGIGGVTIDWYAGFAQINWYSQGIYQYRQWFMDALCKKLPQLRGVYETCRFPLSEDEAAIHHSYGESAPHPLIIKENGVQYAIHLGEEWMTGLFLDQRDVRQFVRTQSQSLSVLNLFSYTGGFSIVAAVGGANRTVSVDVANRSLIRTKENFALNDIEVANQHEIRVMDVFDYVQYAKRHHIQFDLVVCDPPSFARTKAYQFRAEHDYGQLATQLFDLTAPGGLCIFSTNHSAYSRQKFLDDLTFAGKKHTGNFQLIQTFGLPTDFPTSADEVSAYLKVFVFYRAD
ncbi:class I SAM-dependent rRNA methyltransferase [Aerococcaceae bacterium NML190073]|nr:class I SAM-dependent rRNA methyltransferase [Aerococcaceae bacterium NML190073]